MQASSTFSNATAADRSRALLADAYVKPVQQAGRRFYAIHSQDGRPIALAASRELAFAFLGQHDLTAADVH